MSICDCPISLVFYNFVISQFNNIVISRCCFAEDGTDLFIRACPTCSTLIFLTRSIKLFICGVVVPVVDAKAPYYFAITPFCCSFTQNANSLIKLYGKYTFISTSMNFIYAKELTLFTCINIQLQQRMKNWTFGRSKITNVLSISRNG